MSVHRIIFTIAPTVCFCGISLFPVQSCLDVVAAPHPVSSGVTTKRSPAWWAQSAGVEDGWNPYTVDIADLRFGTSWTGMLSGFVYPLVDDEAAYWYKVVNYADECDMFFGGIRGTDTCVIGENWYPGDITFEIGQPVKTSSLKTFPFYDPTAIHELEVRQTLCDTMMQWASIDEHTRDTMEPLGILVRKSILASKKSFLRRSVIVDCSFTNISDSAIHRACIGIVVNAPMVLDSRAGYNGLTARQWAETHTPQSG